MNFEKRFSIPHYDLAGEKTIREFYTLIKNTSDEYRSEISDIYFGAQFMGNQLEREEKLYYGNAMGVYASEREVNDLFQVQEEYKIPISLTLNQIVQTRHKAKNANKWHIVLCCVEDFLNCSYLLII